VEGPAVSFCPSDLTAPNKSHRPPLCHPERTRISCHAALDTAACAVFRRKKPHEVRQRQQDQQEIWGSRGICSFTFGHSNYAGGESPPGSVSTVANRRSLRYATPDFLSRLVALAPFMRLSSLKAAHVAIDCVPQRLWRGVEVPVPGKPREPRQCYLTHAVRSFSTTEPAPSGPAAVFPWSREPGSC